MYNLRAANTDLWHVCTYFVVVGSTFVPNANETSAARMLARATVNYIFFQIKNIIFSAAAMLSAHFGRLKMSFDTNRCHNLMMATQRACIAFNKLLHLRLLVVVAPSHLLWHFFDQILHSKLESNVSRTTQSRNQNMK